MLKLQVLFRYRVHISVCLAWNVNRDAHIVQKLAATKLHPLEVGAMPHHTEAIRIEDLYIEVEMMSPGGLGREGTNALCSRHKQRIALNFSALFCRILIFL
jgi:hypothetical protein